TGKVPVPFATEYQIPVPFFILIGVAVAAAVFLRLTVWGRYLLAVGRNEQAARYSGINTHRIIILSYVLCALLSGLVGVLSLLEYNTILPPGQGTFYALF